MYSVTKRLEFCYGHRLLDYDGICKHPHGHNAVAEIEVRSGSQRALGLRRQALPCLALGGLGAAQAAQAKPDGHTLMIMSTSHLFAPAIYKDLPYDALTAFVPVTRLVSSGFVMVVHPSVQASTVREFIALAQGR